MTFVEMMIQRLRDRPHQVVLKEMHAAYTQDVTGSLLLQSIGSVQACLEKYRVQKGARVVILGPNSTQWIACDLGVLSWGAVTVPMYHRQDISETVFMIQDCEPALVIVWDHDVLKQLQSRLLQGFQMVLLEEAVGQPKLPRVNHILPADCVTFCYTSGTSGKPKGAMISRANMEYMLKQTKERLVQTLGNVKSERVFHFLPFCFMGSRVMMHTQLYRGKTLWLSMDLNRLKEDLSLANPHYYLNVPAVLERIKTGVQNMVQEKSPLIQSMYQAGEDVFLGKKTSFPTQVLALLSKFIVFRSIRKKIGKNLKFLICGSAPLQKSTQEWFRMLGIPVLQVYGLTETTAIISMDTKDQVLSGYVGKPIPGCEVKLSAEQELLCKGAGVFMGYWKRDEESKAMLTEDGWLKTGDQAEIDSAGRLKILGRVKNVLVAESGHNIVPEPIEEKLKSLCPKLEHVVVIGHARPYLTAILTGSASKLDVERAIEELNRDMPHYRKIKQFYLSPDIFTAEKGQLTANQKIRRAFVENEYREHIQKMYDGASKSL